MKPRVEGQRGFTLLEVLVATLIMAIAITGLVANMTRSTRNATALRDYDRVSILAKRKMDELLLNRQIIRFLPIRGEWNAIEAGGVVVRWQAVVTPWEFAPNPGANQFVLDRMDLTLAWNDGARDRKYSLEGYRRAPITEQDAQQLAAGGPTR